MIRLSTWLDSLRIWGSITGWWATNHMRMSRSKQQLMNEIRESVSSKPGWLQSTSSAISFPTSEILGCFQGPQEPPRPKNFVMHATPDRLQRMPTIQQQMMYPLSYDAQNSSDQIHIPCLRIGLSYWETCCRSVPLWMHGGTHCSCERLCMY